MRAVPSARPLPSEPRAPRFPTVRLRRALRLGRRRYTPLPMRAKSRLSIVGADEGTGLAYRRNARLSWENVRWAPRGPHLRGQRDNGAAHVSIIDRFEVIESDICGYAYMCLVFGPEHGLDGRCVRDTNCPIPHVRVPTKLKTTSTREQIFSER